jgi:hypothetical protein
MAKFWLGVAIWVCVGVAVEAKANPQVCPVFADMAIVARALGAVNIDRGKAEVIMQAIYEVPPEFRQFVTSLTDQAYAKAVEPRHFAEQVFARCMASGGNPKAFIGVRS